LAYKTESTTICTKRWEQYDKGKGVLQGEFRGKEFFLQKSPAKKTGLEEQSISLKIVMQMLC
jgi:hypothetical protein